jgi:hypothetical protein
MRTIPSESCAPGSYRYDPDAWTFGDEWFAYLDIGRPHLQVDSTHNTVHVAFAVTDHYLPDEPVTDSHIVYAHTSWSCS